MVFFFRFFSQLMFLFSLSFLGYAEPKTILCTACHGEVGLSSNPTWPHLAGQHAGYLLKQLRDFKQGEARGDMTMSPIAAGLSEDDMKALAEFYSKLPQAKGETAEQYRQRGETLYRLGDASKHITACITCHGPHGQGNEQAGFPVLSGQQVEYTLLQLQAFKNKSRSNDPSGVMQQITLQMESGDMEALAHYLAGLR